MLSSSTRRQPAISRFLAELRSAMAFVRGLLARPNKVASVIPSSSMVHGELERLIREKNPELVIELGPGTGGTTRALLNGLAPDARLLAIEIVPEFVEQLRQIDDDRLIVHEGDAARFIDVLGEHGLSEPDLIVSGVPFSVMEPSQASSLIANLRDALAPNGLFVAYQVRDKVSQYANQIFGDPDVSFIPWNLPPLRLYQWNKPTPVVGNLST